jgi:hypothetical protein
MSKAILWMLAGILLTLGSVAGCGKNASPSEGQEECDCDPSQVQNADLQVSDAAPDFRLPDHRGGYVRLSDYAGKSNVVIAFFPAAFTPV